MDYPSNFDSKDISNLLADWLLALSDYAVGALVVLGPDPFGDAATRLVRVVRPQSMLSAASTLAQSTDFGVQWRASDSSLASWQNLSEAHADDRQGWRSIWFQAGYLSVSRISFALDANRSFDCFMFSRRSLSGQSEAQALVWSALNIWPSLKTAIGLAVCELTTREVDCLKLAFVGLTSKQAAERLGLSARTVDFHLRNATKKLCVNNRWGAIQRAFWMGAL